jgi:hypothetical protein
MIKHVWMAFAILIGFSSCHYYRFKQGNNSVYEKTVAGIERKFSYVLVHAGGDVFRLKHPDYNRNGIIGIKDTVPKNVYAIYNRALGKSNLLIRRKERKNDALLDDQVHLFVNKFDAHSDTIVIQNSDLTKVEYFRKNKGLTAFASIVTTIGTVVGAQLAFVFLACGCPHAYVQEGDQWVFSNTLFTGASNPKIERVDIKKMPDVSHKASTYSFQLRNEENEMQFINQLELIEVRHQEGTAVISTQDGEFHPFKSWVSPTEAKDSEGNLCTQEIQHADLRVHDFKTTEKDGFSYLYTSFDRESALDNQMLVLTAKNTGWSGYLYEEFTHLFGSNYQKWVKRNANLSKRKIEKRLHEAGLKLEVDVWIGDEWQPIEQIELVGNVKYQQVAINIPPVALKNQTLKFRFRSGFHFWEVDQVALGVLDTEPLTYQLQQPTISNTSENTAIRPNDGEYLELGPKSAPLLVTFEGLSTTGERTLFLKSKGYYRPMSNFDGRSDLKTLNQIRKKGLSVFSKEKFLTIEEIKQAISFDHNR